MTGLLRALETEGGKIFANILMIVILGSFAIALALTGHQLQEAGRTAIVGAFTSLFTVLIQNLRISSGPPK